MKIKDMLRAVALNDELEAIRNMQKLIADTASNNLAVGLRTTLSAALERMNDKNPRVKD